MVAAAAVGFWLLMFAVGRMRAWKLMGLLWLGRCSFLMWWGWSMHRARIVDDAAAGAALGDGAEGVCLGGMGVFGSGELRLC